MMIQEKIEMVDLLPQHKRLGGEIDSAIMRVVGSGRYIKGGEVGMFEKQLAHYLGVKHVISCGNGTDALTAALMALGLNRGDEVITTPFSFIAAAEAISLLQLTPVFVDIHPGSFNINPQLLEDKITPRTKAIIPVHLYGQPADMDAILDIAARHKLFVVEDNAQSLGATFENGKKAGTVGDIGCTSFFPSKNLGCMGDGGALMTNNDVFAQQIRRIVNHGSDIKYYHSQIGLNSRLDTIQAAILLVKLPHLDDFNNRRRKAADYYDAALNNIGAVEIPSRVSYASHVFHQYTIRVKNGERDALKEYLDSHGVPSMIYYPVALHRQEIYEPLCKDEVLPVSELACDEVLSLPMHTELTDGQLKYITDCITRFFTEA